MTATTPPPSFTATPAPPTITPQLLAAWVNGQEVTLEMFQAEMSRYQAASGTELATEDKQRVLNDLIDQYLLAQVAQEMGFTVDENMLQEHIDQMTAELGGVQVLMDWMEANGYTEQSFRVDLARSIASAWMRDQILAQIPTKAEQVHARQILLYNPERADEVLNQLRAGTEFLNLAAQYNPVTKGDLGWFPRGYLLDKKLEEVVFKLQPGEYSEVIQTHAGYHIIQVIERDPQRPLDPDALLVIQSQGLQDWLSKRRSESRIELLMP